MTKTLEEIVQKMQVAPCGEYVPPTKERLMEVVQEVHNTALDACREKMPGEREEFLDGTREQFTRRAGSVGWNDCRKEALSAIDSLRTVGSKETV